MDQQLTPDERLLHLIDNPASAKPRASVRLRQAGERVARSRWWNRWQALKRQHAPSITGRRVHVWLAGLCGLVTIGWVVDFLNVRREFVSRLEAIEQGSLAPPQEASQPSGPSSSITELLQDATPRNLFTFVSPQEEADPEAATKSAVLAALTEQVNELKLVGILWSDTPQVLVETKDAKTHLLSVGDTFGSFTIKQVFGDRAILSAPGSEQEWELR